MIDNTMAKRKWTKGQRTIYKILYRKRKIEQHELHQNPGWTQVLTTNYVLRQSVTLFPII